MILPPLAASRLAMRARLTILFDDDCLVAIDKPTGLATIPGRGEATSALEQLAAQVSLPSTGTEDPRIRVVHGVGMGVLRRTLRDFLRQHPHVVSVTEPPYNEGGQGATIVELRQ